jgi:thiamine-phosphate pyrophosphorylase
VKLRGLYAITPEASDAVEKVRLALEGGVALLQYRRKQRDLAEAREVATLARRHGVPLIVNDDVELALELEADGVHLGRDDGDLGAARRRLAGRIVGASCYGDAELARRAVEAGADYVAFGSVFASPTKPAACARPSPSSRRGSACRSARSAASPLRTRRACSGGSRLLAVVSDLFDAPDIRARAAQYQGLFA